MTTAAAAAAASSQLLFPIRRLGMWRACAFLKVLDPKSGRSLPPSTPVFFLFVFLSGLRLVVGLSASFRLTTLTDLRALLSVMRITSWHICWLLAAQPTHYKYRNQFV